MQGSWRAVTVGEVDKKTAKVKIKVLGMMEGIPTDDLPWAEFLLPVGNGYIPTTPGDSVWVDFPYNGDTRRPRITGGAMDQIGGAPNIAAEAGGRGTAGGGHEEHKFPNVPGQPPLPHYASPADHTLQRNQVLHRNGILEMRTYTPPDASGSSAKSGYMMVNTTTNAVIAMNQDGDVIISTTGKVFVHSGGDMTLDSGGDLNLNATGKIAQKAGGSFDLEAGDATFKAGHFAFSRSTP